MSNLYNNLRLYPLFLKDREGWRSQKDQYIDNKKTELNKMIADFKAINIDQLDDLNKRDFYNVVFSNLSPLKKYMNNIKLSTDYQDRDKAYYTPYLGLIDEYADLNKDALDKLQPLIEGINSRLKVNRSLPKTAPESTMEMDIQGGRKKSRSRDTLRPSKSRSRDTLRPSKSRSRDTLRPSKSRSRDTLRPSKSRSKSKRGKSRAKSKRRH